MLRARIHRKIGFCVAAFLILFVCSGILLHHTEYLQLDSSYVSSSIILDHYGFDKTPSVESIIAFTIKQSGILVQLDDKVYLNARAIFDFHGTSDKMIAACKMNQYLFFATHQQVFIFDDSGELFDTLDTPFAIRDMGMRDDSLVINSDDAYRVLGRDLLSWEIIPTPSQSMRLPSTNQYELQSGELLSIWDQHRTGLLSWSRVIQDVHSGRIGGQLGNLLADIAAIALLLLAISGLSMGKREKQTSR